MSLHTLSTVKPTTLNDEVYEAIKKYLLGGQLEIGKFLRDQDIAAAIGVSRTPVREALIRLATEGLIERVPRRGFRVPDESFKDIIDLYPIISELERYAGETALPLINNADLERLKTANQNLREAIVNQDPLAAVKWNNQFHAILCERCGNPRLCGLLNDLRQQVTRLEVWFYTHHKNPLRSPEGHQRIIKALQASDHKTALQLVAEDYSRGIQAIRENHSLKG